MTRDEIKAQLIKMAEAIANDMCAICDRPIEAHNIEEEKVCVKKTKEQTAMYRAMLDAPNKGKLN